MAEPVSVISPASEASSDTRRDWALGIVAAGGMAMTIFAGFSLWLLSGNATYIFYMGMAAMVQIAIIFTGILGLLVKRRLSVTKSEFKVSDFEPEELITKKDATEAVQEAVEQIPPVDDGSTNKPS